MPGLDLFMGCVSAESAEGTCDAHHVRGRRALRHRGHRSGVAHRLPAGCGRCLRRTPLLLGARLLHHRLRLHVPALRGKQVCVRCAQRVLEVGDEVGRALDATA